MLNVAHTSHSSQAYWMNSANALFDKTRHQNIVSLVKKVCGRGPKSLRTLAMETAKAQTNATIEFVEIKDIVGSNNPGRTKDFDCDFRPLSTNTKDRWLDAAALYMQGKRPAPVSLIKAEDGYFVVDGHHRISVAKAMGETAVKAQVVAA